MFWLSMLMFQAYAGPQLPGLLKSAMGGPEKQAYDEHCKGTYDEAKALEARVGRVKKETIGEYTNARLGLDYALKQCANIETKDGSDYRHKQTEAVNYMYGVFVELHQMIDRYGTPQSFDSTSQNLFDPAIPLNTAHWICNPERMINVGEFVEKSWMLGQMSDIEAAVKGKTSVVSFENKLAEDRARFTAIAMQKSQECLGTKLEKVKPYVEAAPASVRAEWEDAVRRAFSSHMDAPIARIVFPHANFKVFKHTDREVLPDGSVRFNEVDYSVMDVFVYVENGDFVDGYVVSIYQDRIKNSEYAQFYGKDANGNFRPSQRVLKQNF